MCPSSLWRGSHGAACFRFVLARELKPLRAKVHLIAPRDESGISPPDTRTLLARLDQWRSGHRKPPTVGRIPSAEGPVIRLGRSLALPRTCKWSCS